MESWAERSSAASKAAKTSLIFFQHTPACTLPGNLARQFTVRICSLVDISAVGKSQDQNSLAAFLNPANNPEVSDSVSPESRHLTPQRLSKPLRVFVGCYSLPEVSENSPLRFLIQSL